MHYKLELWSYGRILRIGTLPTEILEYIVDDFDGDANAYFEAWDNDEIPEELQAGENMCCDDVHCDRSCTLNLSRIVIKDHNDIELCRFDNLASALECAYTTEQIENESPYFIASEDSGKGRWLIGTFDTEGNFDPKKLTVVCRTVELADFSNGPFIVAIKYDGNIITESDDYVDYKGRTAEIIEQ